MTTPLLQGDGISAGYRDHEVLKQVRIQVSNHQFIGIIGPNGSGKSTLMQVIARSVSPSSGLLLYQGEGAESFSFREFGEVVGFVAQESEIPFAYPVYDVVMMGRNPHIPRFRQPSHRDHEIVRNALEQTGTLPLANRPVTSLSGGERQRVLIARVLAQDPALLLLDEPFAHIDLHHQHELLRIIRETTRGRKAVIGVFHDINLAASSCDHLILIHEGVIRASGTPREVLTGPLLREYFRITPVIGENPVTGTPHLYVSGSPQPVVDSTQKVYVISGGGSGTPLISRLVSAGHQVSCGVLSENDADCRTARSLGLDVITEPPFAQISLEHEMLVYEQIAASHRVILTPMPVGWGNFPNIRVLERIEAEKIILYLPDDDPLIPDFTAGAATCLIHRLIEAGAVRVRSTADVAEILNQRVGE